MATLLNCKAISKHFGTRELFSNLSISFGDDEHVGMFGPNGSGKTTFLKMLAGQLDPDGGEVERRRTARIGFLPQQDIFAPEDTVSSALAAAIAAEGDEEHDRELRVNILLTKFGFADADRPVRELSGGWRKRLAIAREVIQQPDILLMDEPTNHLDLAGIEWLEEMLLAAPFAFLAVSHDRYFLERVTDRVVELNPIYPEGYFSASGSYSQFLDKRAEYFEARQAQEATLSNIVRREAAFLKSHAKAQRTKTKFRTEEAHRLVDELKELKSRNAQTRTAGIEFAATGRQSKKLLEAKDIAKSMGGRLLFKDVSVFLSPCTRLGLIGLNGSGKTTLIRVLTGALPPDEGTIQRADDLRIVVFDQMREALPLDVPLRRALAGQAEAVEFGGRKIHITAWAKRFLFRQDQMDMPVKELSGGEQARIQIARLMLKPADLLVLDEPTNDLDIGSLDVLEESLMEFPGAIVLVTHDRFMLDRVSTEILGLDGDGSVGKYTSAAHWQEAQARLASAAAAAAKSATASKGSADGGSAKASDGKSSRSADGKSTKAVEGKSSKPKSKVERTGLTASEAKELKEMEATLQDADDRVAECEKAVADPSVGGDLAEVQKRWSALESARQHVQALYARWEELEAKAK